MLKSKWVLTAGILINLFIVSSAYATPQINWHPVGVLTAGAAFTSDAGKSTTIPAQNGVLSFFDYANREANQNEGLIGALLGAEVLLNPDWSLQGGISYYAESSFRVRGIVTQGIDSMSSNSYSYRYRLQSQQLLAEGKLLYNWCIYHPYLDVGAGAAFNNADRFSVDIQQPFTTFSNQFHDQHKTSFSYLVGIGIDWDVTQSLRFGLGYRFTDLGRFVIGPAVIDTVSTNNSLSQSHLYVQELNAQLTFNII